MVQPRVYVLLSSLTVEPVMIIRDNLGHSLDGGLELPLVEPVIIIRDKVCRSMEGGLLQELPVVGFCNWKHDGSERHGNHQCNSMQLQETTHNAANTCMWKALFFQRGTLQLGGVHTERMRCTEDGIRSTVRSTPPGRGRGGAYSKQARGKNNGDAGSARAAVCKQHEPYTVTAVHA